MSGSNDFVHLTDPGTLTQLAKNGYGGDAETQAGSVKNFLSKAEGAQAHYQGVAGSASGVTSATTAGNSGHLAKHLADEALRAVFAEKEGVAGDEEAHQGQQAAGSAAETFVSTVTKPINV